LDLIGTRVIEFSIFVAGINLHCETKKQIEQKNSLLKYAPTSVQSIAIENRTANNLTKDEIDLAAINSHTQIFYVTQLQKQKTKTLAVESRFQK
jgi:hypothetical protein